MYEALAVAIEMNNGPAADIKKSLNFAADLPQRTHNPNHLVSVADQLFLKGYFDRVGALLDEAMPKVPHRFEPDRDVDQSRAENQRPGPDGRFARTPALAGLARPRRVLSHRSRATRSTSWSKPLRAEDKGAEADVLQKKLEESMSRDVFVRLSWDGYADFDLSVDEPLGATASYTCRAPSSAAH